MRTYDIARKKKDAFSLKVYEVNKHRFLDTYQGKSNKKYITKGTHGYDLISTEVVSIIIIRRG